MNRLRTILERVLRRPGHRSAAQQVIDSTNSPLDVPTATELLVRVGDDERVEIGRRLSALMRKTRPRDWRRLQSSHRTPWILPGHIAKLERLPADDAVELLGVATLAASGYTREAALDALARLGHPRAVPYVLLRLGDWVEQVRESAAATLRALMDLGVAAALIEHHHLVEQLRTVRRTDLSDLHAEIRRRLLSASSRADVEAGLAAPHAATRLFCFRLLETELLHRPALVAMALRDREPLVRGWIAGKVAHGELAADDEIIRSLMCDRAAHIGTTMIRALTLAQIDSYRAELIELAMAESRSVRASARFALGRAGGFDVAAACRSRLHAGPREAIRPGWVECLGETGDASDLEQLAAVLDHPRPRVRAAAVLAAARLDAESAAPRIKSLLADPSGRVARAVVSVLTKATPTLWIEDAFDLLESGPQGAQSAALSALTARGGWDAVPPLLRALSSSFEDVRNDGWQGICEWHHVHGPRGWLKPSGECRAAISDVWPQVRRQDAVPAWAAQTWVSLQRWIDQVL